MVLRDTEIDTPERVDHALEPGEVDVEIVVDVQTGQVRDRPRHQRWAAVCEAATSDEWRAKL